MSRSAMRILFTILLYFGVGVFLYPYFTGRLSRGIPFLIGGAAITVIFGLCRCFLTEGDCSKHPTTKPAP